MPPHCLSEIPCAIESILGQHSDRIKVKSIYSECATLRVIARVRIAESVAGELRLDTRSRIDPKVCYARSSANGIIFNGVSHG